MAWFLPSALQARMSTPDLAVLSTGDGRATSPDQAVLQAALDQAEVEIRGVLAGRTIPSSPVGLLIEIGIDLAIEALWLRQKGAAAKVPEGWATRIKRSRSLLDKMANGEIPVPGATAPTSGHRIEIVDPVHAVDGAFGGRR